MPDPADRMVTAVETIAATLQALPRFFRLTYLLFGALLVLVTIAFSVTIEAQRKGHAALLQAIDQSAQTQAAIVRRLTERP